MTRLTRNESQAGRHSSLSYTIYNSFTPNLRRCDRILFKSTVEPDPEEDAEELPEHFARPRNRLGLFIANAFRLRRESYSSMTSVATSGAASTATATSHADSPDSPDVLEQAVPFSRFVSLPPPSPETPTGLFLSKSRSNDNLRISQPSTPLRSPSEVRLRRSNSASSSPPPPPSPLTRPQRRATASAAASGPPLSPISPTEPSPDTESPRYRDAPQLPVLNLWGRILPSFLSHTNSPFNNNNNTEERLPTSYPAIPQPRKGDVICLSYNTLDDRGMRRLEGRSDHRPVIGTYAIYL